MAQQTILEGYSNLEKGAYLGAIASLATADREASEEEIAYIRELCNAAQLSGDQKALIEKAATELSGDELNRCLDVLKGSDLKYSLVTDLIAFAKADNNYSETEQQTIQRMSEYLGVNEQQFSLLDQFAQKATEQPRAAAPENASPQSLFGLSGLQDKMQSAGINTNGLFKGLLSMAAPLLIGGMLSRGFGRRGGMFGGGGFGMGGGLGSLIGMMGGGGFGSTGGLLGRVFGGGF